MLQGVISILQTPYRDDYSIDRETLRREVDWVFECRANGVGLAMASEVSRFTDEERDGMVGDVVKAVAGRGPVVASVGAESIWQAVRHAKAAAAAGADMLMAIPPAINRPLPDELDAYFSAILDATGLPLIVQDASGYLGNPIPVAAQAALFERYGDRVLFKPEAPPRGANLSALRDATGGRAAIFEGTGGSTLMDSYPRGIRGTMPGADVPWALVALWEALETGDMRRAAEIHAPVGAMVSLMHNLDAFLAVFKLLLREQGIFKNTIIRPPLATRLDPETIREVMRLYADLRQICQ